MPISEYFKGHGKEVMSSMNKKYGERGKEVFYATAKKKGMERPGKKKKRANTGPSDKVIRKHTGNPHY